jgi:probable HAF family extracellular repeat protein
VHNDRGQIVGVSTTAKSSERGFLWRRGKMTNLGVQTANDINNNGGEIVGGTTFGSVFHAYLWRHGRITNLGQLPSRLTYSEAMFINQRGQIAGNSASPDNHALAVLWRHRRLVSLGTPKGDLPLGLNDRGHCLPRGTLAIKRPAGSGRRSLPDAHRDGLGPTAAGLVRQWRCIIAWGDACRPDGGALPGGPGYREER